MKDKVRKTRRFVSKHRMVLGCAATGVVTAVVVHKMDVEATRDWAYGQGYKFGELQAYTSQLLRNADKMEHFIEAKGLWEDLQEYLETA